MLSLTFLWVQEFKRYSHFLKVTLTPRVIQDSLCTKSEGCTRYWSRQTKSFDDLPPNFLVDNLKNDHEINLSIKSINLFLLINTNILIYLFAWQQVTHLNKASFVNDQLEQLE